MRLCSTLSSLILLLSLQFNSFSQSSPTLYVNPFIGTGGHGHTFPGATVPFGMVQLSPDTRLEGWDGCGGYHYSDSLIYGFSHTHLSGTGIPDYGDILLMPFTGQEYWNNGYDGKPGYRSSFSHSDEAASPGYYRVKLKDDDINVELTASARAGFHSYLFRKGDIQKVLIDLEHRDNVTNSWIKSVSDYELEGYRGSTAWANDQRVYFVIKFSEKITATAIALNNIPVETKGMVEGKNVKAILNFGRASGSPLLVKVGISAISVENARQNLNSAIDDNTPLNPDSGIKAWNFEQIRNSAIELWNNELGKIKVTSKNINDLTIFYTALYHTMVSPNLYNDSNGSYLGRDFKEHKTANDYYTVFSLWDTYRALHPLMTIIDQKRTNDFIRTFIQQYKDGRLLPVWELSANETWCMIGYHAVPVIADAYMKGIRDYDTETAFKAMLTSAHQDQFGLKYYKKFGFIPADSDHESVSKTLEYAYDDWCIAHMAESMGKKQIADSFMIRAQGYKHLFDQNTGFMRARFNGAWFMPFDAREVNFNYTEANSWQYSFYVPHDMDHFIQLHGGKKGLEQKLDALFTAPVETTGREQSDITGLIGQYAHGNEPSHHIVYLYNFAGRPWKTQEKVNYILKNFYTNNPDGLIGNEDCGQMSAWAVLSSLGFYPVCPGSNQYVIGTPKFEEVILNLENGNRFIIIGENLSDDNLYIQSATLNGKPYNKSFLLHEDIIKGGTLIFKMGSKSNEQWGIGPDNEPSTGIKSIQVTPAPVIEKMDQLFDKSASVTFSSFDGKTIIRFTTDGSEPNEHSAVYTKPFNIDNTTTIKYRGYKEGFLPSATQQCVYTKRPEGITLTLKTNYAQQYSGNGVNTLVDGLKGSEDFRLGGWQGYQGVDIEADIILSNDNVVRSVEMGFMQDINAWIFMPEMIEVWSSSDGKEYRIVGKVINDIPQDQWGTILKNYRIDLNVLTDRYLRIRAINIKECPADHKGRGNKAWIFSDEISIGY